MAEPISYIGAEVAVAIGAPATIDVAGFEAAGLTYKKVGRIASFGEVGGQSEDITVLTLEGRTLHMNGSLDGGAIDFTFVVDKDSEGQGDLGMTSNTQDDVSVRITDPDNERVYFSGKVANVRDMARDPSSYKGKTGQFRVNTLDVRTTFVPGP